MTRTGGRGGGEWLDEAETLEKGSRCSNITSFFSWTYLNQPAVVEANFIERVSPAILEALPAEQGPHLELDRSLV